MTDTTISPFVLLRTATGLVSVDVRTIAGAITHAPDHPERLYLRSTITDPTTLHFANAKEADAAVTLLHAAREQHDDARAEDARAKVVGEVIRESGRELVQEVSHVLRLYMPDVREVFRESLLASSRTTESAPRDEMPTSGTQIEVGAVCKFLGENGYVTRKIDVKANGLVQLHLTCGAVVCLYTTTGTAVVQGKPSDADRKAIIELLRIDEWKV